MNVSFSSPQRSSHLHTETDEPSTARGQNDVDPIQTAFSEPYDQEEGVYNISLGGRIITVKNSVVQRPQGQTKDEWEEFNRWVLKNGPALADALQQIKVRRGIQQTLLGAAEKLEALDTDNQIGIWKQSSVPDVSEETTPEHTPEYDDPEDPETERWRESKAREWLRWFRCPPCCPPEVGYPVTESDLKRLSELDRGATVFHMRGGSNPVFNQRLEWSTNFATYQEKARSERGLQSQQLEIRKTLEDHGLFPHQEIELNENIYKLKIVRRLAEYLTWKQELYKSHHKEQADDPDTVPKLLKGVIAWTVHHLQVLTRAPVATQGEPASYTSQADTVGKKTQKRRKRGHDNDGDNNREKEEGSGDFVSTEPPEEQKWRQKRRKTSQQGVQQSVQSRVQRRNKEKRGGGTLEGSLLPLQSSRATRSITRARPEMQFFYLDSSGSVQLIPTLKRRRRQ